MMIVPPTNLRFSLTNVSCTLDTREDDTKKHNFVCFLVWKELLSIDDIGVASGTAFHQEIRSGAGFKTGDSVEVKLGCVYRKTTLDRCHM